MPAITEACGPAEVAGCRDGPAPSSDGTASVVPSGVSAQAVSAPGAPVQPQAVTEAERPVEPTAEPVAVVRPAATAAAVGLPVICRYLWRRLYKALHPWEES